MSANEPDETNESAEIRAMEEARRFFKKNGWAVENVSRKGGNRAGYDLLISKDSKEWKIEVKGSKCKRKPYAGIPDLFDSEVSQDRTLTADFLFIGYFPAGKPSRFAILARDHFPPAAFTTKTCYRIKSEFKNGTAINAHIIDVNEKWEIS